MNKNGERPLDRHSSPTELSSAPVETTIVPATSKVVRRTVSVDEALNEAVALHRQGNLPQAQTIYEAILRNHSNNFNALHLLGVVRSQQGKYEEAIGLIGRALRVNPKSADAHYNLGDALRNQGRNNDAVSSYRRALAIRPDYAKAHINLAIALADMKRNEDAVVHYRRSLAIEPNNADAHVGLGNALRRMKRFEEAIANYQRALDLRPDFPFAPGALAYAQRRVCDWKGASDIERELREGVRQGRSVVAPFAFLSLSDDPDEQFRCARLTAEDRFGSGYRCLFRKSRLSSDRIRLGYLSADFCEHATAYLMAELFEQHDRDRFEVFAFSYGRDDDSAMRKRLRRGFDHFVDVRDLSDSAAARRLAELGIQIAIDLKGYTKDGRMGILAGRPAPIQVNYLGYPGTMGADFIDYILVDPFVAPSDRQPFFAEQLVHLPDCFQVNDSQRAIADRTPSRLQCGLPDDGFIFCAFNNTYKITPTFFDVWMRLLGSVPGSVLWLLRDNEAAERNLRREALARGVDPERLIFAPRQQLSKHLARQRLAGLFLDTLPVNAHTTASDALWAGLPVLTCVGQAFAGRVAGSLLRAVGLPELVTHSLEEYEALALKLATHPELLNGLRNRLAENRATSPLFDTDRFRRHIEAAYEEMWRRWESGEPPRPFSVEPLNTPS